MTDEVSGYSPSCSFSVSPGVGGPSSLHLHPSSMLPCLRTETLYSKGPDLSILVTPAPGLSSCLADVRTNTVFVLGLHS